MLADSDVTIAVIGALGIVLAASVPALLSFLSLRRGQNEIRDRVGVPNGRGNIAEMNEAQLDHQAAHREQLRELNAKLEAIQTEMRDTFEHRTETFEAGVAPWRQRFEDLERTHAEILERIDRLASQMADRADHIDEALVSQDAAAATVASDLLGNQQGDTP